VNTALLKFTKIARKTRARNKGPQPRKPLQRAKTEGIDPAQILGGNNDNISAVVDDIPKYSILSHTWGAEEVTFEDMINGIRKSKAGYDKIWFCAQQTANDCLQFF
jgi:hypothetical protein